VIAPVARQPCPGVAHAARTTVVPGRLIVNDRHHPEMKVRAVTAAAPRWFCMANHYDEAYLGRPAAGGAKTTAAQHSSNPFGRSRGESAARGTIAP